jgi:NAD(P) transhydrogenase subunit alpha
MEMINIITVFILALFVGIEIITKVPPTLHTPLMSGSNAISGIAIVGAIIATKVGGELGTWLGLVAVIFATINCVGGFMVTVRMIKMFKRKSHDRLYELGIRHRCNPVYSGYQKTQLTQNGSKWERHRFCGNAYRHCGHPRLRW